jgi:AraC-like DNA-binding protein
MLKCVQAQARASPGTCKFANAKFVLVASGDEGCDAASMVHADECLSLECAEREVFATVQKLIGFESTARWWDMTPANGELPAPEARDSFPRGGLAPGALRRVREHVDKHLTQRLRTEDLATVAGLSQGHFNRAFKQSMGQPPHQYVLQRRVAVASELLEKTDRALAEIALDVGFADQSHFSRTYASVTGETPSACRRRNR